MKPVVAIVGRPNVGKSSLFNRILGRTKALVEDIPGVTRDRNYAMAHYGDRAYVLVDTGGFEDDAVAPDERKALARIVREAAAAAVEEADVIVVILDGQEGPNPADTELVERVRRSHKPAIYAINKIDHPRHVERSYEFYELGIEDAIPISAAHGLGVADLIEAVVERLPERTAGEDPVQPWDDEGRRKRRRRKKADPNKLADGMPAEAVTGPSGWRDRGGEGAWAEAKTVAETETETETESESEPESVTEAESETEQMAASTRADAQADADDGFVLRVAVLGRPNVGKSTLINRLLGYERCLVSDVAGTTRDSTDTFVEIDGRPLILIDTAGIRRRARVRERVERMTVQRALRMVEAAHVVLLMVDADEGVTDQDARLGELARDRGRALLLLANKWDLSHPKLRAFRDDLARRMPHLAFAPVLPVSALTGQGMDRLMPTLERVAEAHRLRVETGALNRWLQGCLDELTPPLHHHHPVRLYYATQAGIRPPRIVLFSNTPEAVPEAYQRFLINRLRSTFPLEGTPVLIHLRKR